MLSFLELGGNSSGEGALGTYEGCGMALYRHLWVIMIVH